MPQVSKLLVRFSHNRMDGMASVESYPTWDHHFSLSLLSVRSIPAIRRSRPTFFLSEDFATTCIRRKENLCALHSDISGSVFLCEICGYVCPFDLRHSLFDLVFPH